MDARILSTLDVLLQDDFLRDFPAGFASKKFLEFVFVGLIFLFEFVNMLLYYIEAALV